MTTSSMEQFVEKIKDSKVLWALTAGNEEDWLVIESATKAEHDVFLLWSSADNARATCTDEWSDYTPTPISLTEYVDFWVEEFANENVLIGLDWADEQENIEVGVVELAQVLIESGVHQDK
ncbi:DUF2750 domain-containing protein [Catenovulum maritimum]|uniref:DUF2750 domain-containing protein n=1 Tax=Catenovulum maritimum TaxID=1513271 RepID=A0A0J8GTZ5_9ALTE|nr:DUF2750 domain-containing protein [Catenovulum maritimum]KMT66235.1 hypothetical protein XM47_04360 [Catenovulum maritimum]